MAKKAPALDEALVEHYMRDFQRVVETFINRRKRRQAACEEAVIRVIIGVASYYPELAKRLKEQLKDH